MSDGVAAIPPAGLFIPHTVVEDEPPAVLFRISVRVSECVADEIVRFCGDVGGGVDGSAFVSAVFFVFVCPLVFFLWRTLLARAALVVVRAAAVLHRMARANKPVCFVRARTSRGSCCRMTSFSRR